MAQERASKILEDVGLVDRMDHRPSELSGGEQQRVAIGRAIVCRPKLLLADEPTGNLDASTSDRITKLLFTVARRENLSGIVVTHNRNIVQNCDRILLLRDGKLTEYPKPAEGSRLPEEVRISEESGTGDASNKKE
jgi:lipoprotein-releasing system ATP-binding protein